MLLKRKKYTLNGLKRNSSNWPDATHHRPLSQIFEAPMSAENVEIAISALLLLTEDERAEVFAKFCVHCGSSDPCCRCWDDS